jgi:hypothetical protein
MNLKCLNGDIIELDNKDMKDEDIIIQRLLEIRPEWNNYNIKIGETPEASYFIYLEPKLQLDITEERLTEYIYRYTAFLFYWIEGEKQPFHTFTFYKHYSTYRPCATPIYRFGENHEKIYSFWTSVKEMIENVHYRVCKGGIYLSENKDIWDVIVKNVHLF